MRDKFARLTFVLMFAAAGILIQATPAAANNDPHRSFAAATPFDLPATFCGFAVHFAFPVDKEYSTITLTADGSTVIKTTGSLFVSLTNNTWDCEQRFPCRTLPMPQRPSYHSTRKPCA